MSVYLMQFLRLCGREMTEWRHFGRSVMHPAAVRGRIVPYKMHKRAENEKRAAPPGAAQQIQYIKEE